MSWLRTTVGQGLAVLLALRLKGCPAEDMVEVTLFGWLAALESQPMQWDAARDQTRLEQAFRLLCAKSRQWPVPADLLDVLKELPRPDKATPLLEYHAATPAPLKAQLAVIEAERQRREQAGLPPLSPHDRVVILAEHRARITGEDPAAVVARLNERLKAVIRR